MMKAVRSVINMHICIYDEIRNRNPKTVINNIIRNTGFKKDDVRIVSRQKLKNADKYYSDTN